MSTLSVAEARAQIETDVNDTALQALIDDAEAEIETRVGAISSQVDVIIEEKANLLFLTRRLDEAGDITSIVEENGSASTTLVASDYKVRGSRSIERLSTGTNPARYWAPIVTVTYAPHDDTVRRKQIAIDLVKLAIVYNGLSSERVGDYSSAAKNYEEERSDLIDRLRPVSLT